MKALFNLLIVHLVFVPAHAAEPPSIRTLVTPALWKKVIDERAFHGQAKLDPPPPGPKAEGEALRRYRYSAFMGVRAPLAETRAAITNYELYPKMISYIHRTAFTPATQTLEIEGGIWKWKLHSHVQFEDRGPRWVHYRVIHGHFAGLAGEIYFEPVGERGTAVYFTGEQRGMNFPPAFVLERGAEIVFHYVAKKMRAFIEDGGARKPAPAISGAPQPRNRRF